MAIRFHGVAVALLAGLAAAGCGERKAASDAGSRIEQATTKATQAVREGDLRKAGEAVGEMGRAVASGSQVEPVDFRELQALLPEKLAGFKRTGLEGERNRVLGISASKARAAYSGEKGARVDLEFVDMGSLTGVAGLALAWVTVEIDREGSEGFERTVKVDGRRAYERYTRAKKEGAIDVLVANRFLVKAEGTGIEAPQLREVIAALDLGALEKK